jgi:arylsulfatase A-like enzyme
MLPMNPNAPPVPHRLPPIGAVLICLALAAVAIPAHAAGKAKHVVIVIMDGLRPDSITQEHMPTLHALSKSGTFFERHHPAFISSTQVNGTTLATGMLPARSGIMANREYRPDIELLGPVDTNGEWAAWKADQMNQGGWVKRPTLPELVRAAGMKTAVAGTKGVAMLWDRGYKNRTTDQPTIFEGRAIPAATLDKIVPDLGPIPPAQDWRYFPNVPQDSWTTRVMTEKLWADGVPAFSVLWLSDPDFSQHGSGPGSANALAGLKSSDDRLASVLEALEKKGVRDATDIFVVSDHGFSTVIRNIEVGNELDKHGFAAGGGFLRAPGKGSILVIGLGGSVTFYVTGNDAEETAKLVTYLQTTTWAGVIFTKDGAEGTFKLSDAGLDTVDAPDVVVSMKWEDLKIERRMRGVVYIEGKGYLPGQGMHCSLSPYDMRCTLIAAGPDFKKGFASKLPSGNLDLAPTVAQILGLSVKEPMDGRVLSEAMIDAPEPKTQVQTQTHKAERRLGDKTWKQYLRVTTYEGRNYVDEGNVGEPPQK